MTDDAIDDIIDTLAFFDDWEERYQYVIDLGKALPPLDDAQKIDANLVKGCQSQVWLVARVEDGPRIELDIDSDAHIVRGLAAILKAMYSGQSPKEILARDSKATFAEIGLDAALSPSRANGLHAMDRKIRALAEAAITNA